MIRRGNRRRRLLDLLSVVDLRLIASGHVHQRRDFTCHHTRHVWAPSAGFVISDARQDRIGTKEVGLVDIGSSPTVSRSATSGRPARAMSISTSCSAGRRREAAPAPWLKGP